MGPGVEDKYNSRPKREKREESTEEVSITCAELFANAMISEGKLGYHQINPKIDMAFNIEKEYERGNER